jgi:hypothetical protein
MIVGIAKFATRRIATAGSSRNAVTVTGIKGREVIDSRGNPTVEVDVHTTAGNFRGM